MHEPHRQPGFGPVFALPVIGIKGLVASPWVGCGLTIAAASPDCEGRVSVVLRRLGLVPVTDVDAIDGSDLLQQPLR